VDNNVQTIAPASWSLMMSVKVNWQGVFPAVTIQFKSDFSLDLDATAKVINGLVRAGVSGLVVYGTVGENTSLSRAAKLQVIEAAKAMAAGRAHWRRRHHVDGRLGVLGKAA
jgi:Dihydrodipicolinate synthetase family